MHVLMIEDYENDYLLVKRYAPQIGDLHIEWRVTLAEGLAYIESHPVDVLLLDMNLPDGSGLDTFDRAQKHFPLLPIIVLSSSTNIELALEAIRHGAQDYLVKGQFSQETLGRSLRYAIERKRVEEHLRQSEQRFSLVVNSIQDYAIYSLDTQGNITTWNPGAERIKGYTAQEIIGRNFACFFPPEALALGEPQQILEIATREGHFKSEGWRVRKDGRRFWADVALTALHDGTGRLIGFAKITRDLTERKLAEEALKDERRLLNILMETVPDLIYFKDTSSRFIRINQAHASVFGLDDPDEAIGKSDVDFQSPELAESFLAEEMRIITSGQPLVNHEEFNPRPDGTPRWFSSTKMPIKDEYGRAIGIVGVSRDITQSKQTEAALREGEEKLQTIFKMLPVGASLMDNNRRIVQMNPALEQIMDMTLDDLLRGKYRSRQYTHSDGTPMPPSELPSEQAIVRQEAVYDVEIGVVKEDGATVWTSVSAAPLPGNQGVVTVTADITQRKQLQQQNFDLALDRERFSLLSQFVRDTSHDIRTPLSIINTSTYLLRKLPLDKQLERIELIEAQVGTINSMLETIHYTAKLWSIEQLNRESVSLPGLIQEVCDRISSMITAKQQRLQITESPITIMAEPAYLSQAFFEFLENASGFTPENGEIEIRQSIRDGFAVIEFRDTGIGMSEEQIAKAFDMFWKADNSRNNSQEHPGLGLAIARRIIELHQGSIQIESQPDLGTTFRILLPISAA